MKTCEKCKKSKETITIDEFTKGINICMCDWDFSKMFAGCNTYPWGTKAVEISDISEIQNMDEYVKWLENIIEDCLEDKDLQREHWAFCQALKKYRKLALTIPAVVGQSEQYCDWCSSPEDVEVKICKRCRQGMEQHR